MYDIMFLPVLYGEIGGTGLHNQAAKYQEK